MQDFVQALHSSSFQISELHAISCKFLTHSVPDLFQTTMLVVHRTFLGTSSHLVRIQSDMYSFKCSPGPFIPSQVTHLCNPPTAAGCKFPHHKCSGSVADCGAFCASNLLENIESVSVSDPHPHVQLQMFLRFPHCTLLAQSEKP